MHPPKTGCDPRLLAKHPFVYLLSKIPEEPLFLLVQNFLLRRQPFRNVYGQVLPFGTFVRPPESLTLFEGLQSGVPDPSSLKWTVNECEKIRKFVFGGETFVVYLGSRLRRRKEKDG